MDGQITIAQYMQDLTHDRRGNLEKPFWEMDIDRCENCKYWQILPIEEQPPEGWGVKGQCNYVHKPEMMENGYWITNKISYCGDFEAKW